MKTNFLLLLVSPFLISSCYTYEPRFDGPLEREMDGEVEFLYVKDNVLFMADTYHNFQKEVVTNIVFASINNEHTKIVYKKENSNIQIYNISKREVVGEVPNSNETISFDFASDNETIYFINKEGVLKTFGELPFDFKEIDLSQIIQNDFEVNSCVLFPDNTIAISGFFNNGQGGLYYMDKDEVIKSGFLQTSFLTNLRTNHNGSELTCTQNFNSQSQYKKIDLENFSLSSFNSVATLIGVPDNDFQNNISYIITPSSSRYFIRRGQEVIAEFEESTFQTIDN